MSDFKHINEFRKGSILSKISEDPTYLSFFMMFDAIDREHSPLLSGPAEEYLRQFVDPPGSTSDKPGKHVANLRAFKKVLLKINKELPWFWQKLNGLEATQEYKDMSEPFNGAEKPKIEIECLEENVELTALGLMQLYRTAVYDYNRFVEVLPKNLRHFRVWIVMSEVRTFQQSIGARDFGLYGNSTTAASVTTPSGLSQIKSALGKGSETQIKSVPGGFDEPLVKNYSAEAKPHVMIELGHCEWETDSIKEMFSDLNKQPELRKPKLSFYWNTSSITSNKFGPNISSPEASPLMPTSKKDDELYPNTPFNPLANIQNAISDKVNGIADGLVNRFNNLKNSLPGQGNNPMGRVYPEGLTGAAATLAEAGMDKVKALFMDNVHGASGALGSLGDINSALEAGSINGIMNLAGQLFKPKPNKPANGNMSPHGIYDPAIDSSPDGFINEKVYDPIAQQSNSQTISPGRIHEPGVDSSPDNSINDNVHE